MKENCLCTRYENNILVQVRKDNTYLSLEKGSRDPKEPALINIGCIFERKCLCSFSFP